MNNPNNKTAENYDIFTRPLKGQSITDEEISFINFLVEPGANILDVGAGTGRHAVTLAEQGYKVTAIDSSKEMLNQLKQKTDVRRQTSRIKIINHDILSYQPPAEPALSGNKGSYELIILMWNSWNEIVLTKTDAVKLLTKLKKSLKSGGKILINIDDEDKVDPANFYFETEFIDKGFTYKQVWETLSYNKKTNTSISQEVIEIIDNGKIIDKKVSKIKQRYWRLGELEEICKKLDLKMEIKKVRGSEELYLLVE